MRMETIHLQAKVNGLTWAQYAALVLAGYTPPSNEYAVCSCCGQYELHIAGSGGICLKCQQNGLKDCGGQNE